MSDDVLNRREALPYPGHGPGRSAGRLTALLLMALVGFAAGGGAVGWMVLRGNGSGGTGSNGMMASAWHRLLPAPASNIPSASPALTPDALIASQTVLDARILAAEQRLDRLDMQATAAAGNAARAEGLLVAFAARRVIERGASLGYLEDQLKLRFGDAQPRAVATLIATARNPVTLDQLTARLQAMAARVADAPASETLWARARRELSNLVTIRRDTAGGPTPAARVDHALAALREGAIEPAIADVQRLPASRETTAWLTDARRYDEAENALDRVETAALLEPHSLGDASGRKVSQPSPLAPPQLGAQPSSAPAGQ